MTIMVANSKGGVGKTTTSINLAAYLAAMYKKTLLVDLDPQGNASSALGCKAKPGEPSLYTVLTKKHRIGEVVRHTKIPGYDIIPTSSELAAATVELLRVDRRRDKRLRELLEPIYPAYDFIIIDSPPGLGLLTINGFIASDAVVVPVQCQYYSLEGLSELLHTIDAINERVEDKVHVLGVVLTMYDKKSRLARAVAAEVRKKFPGHVFRSTIPLNEKLAIAPSFSKTVLEYSPYSHGAKAYRSLAEEVITLTNFI